MELRSSAPDGWGMFDSFSIQDFGVSEDFVLEDERLYFLWERFTPLSTDYTGRKNSDFDYEVSGGNVEIYEPPHFLTSVDFQKFWHGYRLHGFICLSDYGCPFPELRQVLPDLFPMLELPVAVPSQVFTGLESVRSRVPRVQQNIPAIAEQTLRQCGNSVAANWVRNNPRDFQRAMKNGFRLAQHQIQ